MINKEKTTLFFSRNTDEQSQEDIKVALNEPTIQHYEKYLGLPSFVGQNKDGALLKSKKEYGQECKDGRKSSCLRQERRS